MVIFSLIGKKQSSPGYLFLRLPIYRQLPVWYLDVPTDNPAVWKGHMAPTGVPNITSSQFLAINLHTEIKRKKKRLIIFYRLTSVTSHNTYTVKLSYITPFGVKFLLQDWKFLIYCSTLQVAQVPLRSKYWDLDPEYFIFEMFLGLAWSPSFSCQFQIWFTMEFIFWSVVVILTGLCQMQIQRGF